MYQCRITANEVYTAGFCCTLQGFCKQYRIFVRASCCQHCNRSDCNSLVNNRNAIFLFNGFTGGNELFCPSCDFVINLIASLMNVRINTIQKRNSHRGCTDIQAFILNHTNGFQNVPGIKDCIIHDVSCSLP